MRNRQICTRCVYDDTVPSIVFDDEGVCNYCKLHDNLCRIYPTGLEGKQKLDEMFAAIRKSGKSKKYDCVIGVSGGTDSSYLMHMAVENGLRPLAVHYDNTWNSPIATQNIYNLLDKLNIDLYTHVVDTWENSDIYRAFMAAGLGDPEVATDIALTTTAYMAADQHGIGTILEGHTFRTEGIAPLDTTYIDGKYIESVHRAYGRLTALPSFPNLTIWRFLYYCVLKGIKRLRPLWYADYNKADARKLLSETYHWKYYGGHHLENLFTAFNHTYIFPRRGSFDTRLLSHAANVRSGFMNRNDALDDVSQAQECPQYIIEMVKSRLQLTDEDLDHMMTLPKRSWREFKTYKEAFEHLRPLFWLMLKMKRVPESFYRKFCFPLPARE